MNRPFCKQRSRTWSNNASGPKGPSAEVYVGKHVPAGRSIRHLLTKQGGSPGRWLPRAQTSTRQVHAPRTGTAAALQTREGERTELRDAARTQQGWHRRGRTGRQWCQGPESTGGAGGKLYQLPGGTEAPPEKHPAKVLSDVTLGSSATRKGQASATAKKFITAATATKGHAFL